MLRDRLKSALLALTIRVTMTGEKEWGGMRCGGMRRDVVKIIWERCVGIKVKKKNGKGVDREASWSKVCRGFKRNWGDSSEKDLNLISSLYRLFHYHLHPLWPLIVLIITYSPSLPLSPYRYVKHVKDIRISVFESLIRSLSHFKIELHRKVPKTESLKDCKYSCTFHCIL